MSKETVPFCHLHVHTEYSLLDGLNKVSVVPTVVKEMGKPALARTDHGTVAGAFQHVKSCRKAGIKPILGIEAYYTINDRSIKERDIDGERYYHLVLLAKNDNGWKNLCALSSDAYTEGFYAKPRVDDELLRRYSKDLIATTACLGSRFSKLLLLNRKDEAERLIDGHIDIFKDNFYIELQLHEDEEQQTVNSKLIEIAAKKNLPLILTNDAHYTHQAHKELHEQALCMQTNSHMHNPNRFSFGPIDVHLGSYEWMAARASEMNIPIEALHNTALIANQIEDTSYFTNIINRYPQFHMLPEEFASSWEYLEWLTKKKLTERFNGEKPPKEYRDRINFELQALKEMGFSDYMLIVQHFVNYAKEVVKL